MRFETVRYSAAGGWSPAKFPDLDSAHTLVLLFGASALFEQPEVFQEVVDAYPQSQLLGCSTAGEIDGINVEDDSIIGVVVQFEHTRLRGASATIGSADESAQTAATIAETLQGEDLRGVFVLSDGVHVNGSQLVAGLSRVLPPSVVVTGGLAGDGDRFVRTWTLHNGVPTTHLVAALGLYGERVQLGHGSHGGWDIFGPERRVTRSRNNVLYELDGKPALELYKRYLGERASELPAAALLFPLSLRASSDDERSVVRTILSIDEDDNSMTFAGDVPAGHLVQLMRANFDRIINASAEAAEKTLRATASGDKMLAIAISCVGRRLVLRSRTEEELEAALEAMPTGTVQIGFYSYGEISPFSTGQCDLHNQTMTLTTISER